MNHIKIILRGVGQVMLQNNALTGLAIIIGAIISTIIMRLMQKGLPALTAPFVLATWIVLIVRKIYFRERVS